MCEYRVQLAYKGLWIALNPLIAPCVSGLDVVPGKVRTSSCEGGALLQVCLQLETLDNPPVKPPKIRFRDPCCSHGATVQGTEHGKRNGESSACRAPAQRDCKCVTQILSNFLYLSCLLSQLFAF